MKRVFAALALSLGSILPGAAFGQEAAPPATEGTADADPARLAAAQRVIDLAFPPAEAREMITSLVGTAFDQQLAAMDDDPALKQTLREIPAMRRPYETLMADMRSMAEEIMGDATPSLLAAVAEIYAARYSVAELGEVEAFLSTPTGRRYARDAFEMMGDERLAAWQSDVAARMEARTRPILDRFMAESVRLATKAGS